MAPSLSHSPEKICARACAQSCTWTHLRSSEPVPKRTRSRMYTPGPMTGLGARARRRVLAPRCSPRVITGQCHRRKQGVSGSVRAESRGKKRHERLPSEPPRSLPQIRTCHPTSRLCSPNPWTTLPSPAAAANAESAALTPTLRRRPRHHRRSSSSSQPARSRSRTPGTRLHPSARGPGGRSARRRTGGAPRARARPPTRLPTARVSWATLTKSWRRSPRAAPSSGAPRLSSWTRRPDGRTPSSSMRTRRPQRGAGPRAAAATTRRSSLESRSPPVG
mmetsp:Transcript_20533/g.39691  ORF Transcript_20533/g.39691 Transcript_20533/m.39691 type:complete len:277 (+) Transcript_20533:351-1181(+)